MPEYVTLVAKVPPGWTYADWKTHLQELIKAEEAKVEQTDEVSA